MLGDHSVERDRCRFCDAESGSQAMTLPCPGLGEDNTISPERRAELELADRIEMELRRPTPKLGAGRRRFWDDDI